MKIVGHLINGELRADDSARTQDVFNPSTGEAQKKVALASKATVEEAIASGNKDDALAALRAAQPELMRGVTKGVFHKNTASRKVSRLTARVKALG